MSCKSDLPPSFAYEDGPEKKNQSDKQWDVKCNLEVISKSYQVLPSCNPSYVKQLEHKSMALKSKESGAKEHHSSVKLAIIS